MRRLPFFFCLCGAQRYGMIETEGRCGEMKHVFVVNPVSGKTDARKFLVPKLEEAARGAGVDYIGEVTQAKGHAVELAKEFAVREEGKVRLYACGGDGTLNEVFEGVYRSGTLAEVASIPCGSGNDYVRTFGQPQDFLNLDSSIRGTAIPVDLIDTGRGICAALCSVGIDAEVAYNIPKFRRVPLCGGQMAYNLSIVERLLGPMGRRLHIEVDDEVFEGDYLICAVCNGKTYGGGYMAGPEADVQDGLLDVVFVKKISRLRIAGVLNLYKNGRHLKNGQVVERFRDIMTYRRARHVRIRPVDGGQVIANIDGECGPAPSLSADVLPAAARFVLPTHLFSDSTYKTL